MAEPEATEGAVASALTKDDIPEIVKAVIAALPSACAEPSCNQRANWLRAGLDGPLPRCSGLCPPPHT